MAERPDIIPAILLTGFLGAGKTTLLNRLIDYYSGTRTVLLINEFGKVGIDGELLQEGDYEKIELNRGSLFCICVRTDFIAAVEKIARKILPERLIIEATGIADTSEMEKMLAVPTIKDMIQLDTCLCVVDCTTFLKIKDNLRAPITQIKSADLVLINKVDLVTDSQVQQIENSVREISPTVPMIRTQFTVFPLQRLGTFRHPPTLSAGVPGEGRPDPLFSVALEANGSFTRESWQLFRDALGIDIFRLKGFITLENERYYVDGTIDRLSIMPSNRIEPGKNRLVVIGPNVKQSLIQQVFLKAIRQGM